MTERFELINKVIGTAEAELVLVMIERTEDATLIHWRFTPTGTAQAIPAAVLPRLDLSDDQHTSPVPPSMRNTGGAGTEGHAVDVYPGRFDGKIVLTDTQGTPVFES